MMHGNADQRLADLGLNMPALPRPAGHYIAVRRYGSVVTTASLSAKNGDRLRYLGIVGSDLSVEQARDSARGSLLNCLAVIHAELGSLDLIRRVVRLTGYIASAPGFVDQHKVMDAASDLCYEIFGDAGRHVRASIGIAALPNNCSVGIELTVEVEASSTS